MRMVVKNHQMPATMRDDAAFGSRSDLLITTRGRIGTGIIALKQESSSRLIRYYRDILKVSTVFLSGLWASPLLLFSAQILA